MTRDEYDALYTRAWDHLHGRGGPALSADERAAVARQVEATSDAAERGRLLYLLGLTRDRSYQHLVARFLADPEGLVAYEALLVLCNYFQLTQHYLDQILRFLRGVPWDSSEMCRICASNAALNYLSRTPDEAFVRAIIRLYEDPQADEKWREGPYNVLVNLSGLDDEDQPLEPGLVLDAVRARYLSR
jgi:hypothetical protein